MIVDHLLMLALFVVQPLHGAWAYRRYVARIEGGEAPDRIGQYRDVLIMEWVAFAVLVAVWVFCARPFADLGFVPPRGTGFVAGLVLLVAATAWLGHAWRQARHADDDERRKLAAALGDLVHFLPNTRRTYRVFCGVSVTAGIVEETVYRGFAFWYLAAWLPMWAVVLVSAVIFGLGHSYQGMSGMFRVTAIGIAFGLFYWLTGSIWLPMAAHMILDILQGGMLYKMLKRNGKGPVAAESPIS